MRHQEGIIQRFCNHCTTLLFRSEQHPGVSGVKACTSRRSERPRQSITAADPSKPLCPSRFLQPHARPRHGIGLKAQSLRRRPNFRQVRLFVRCHRSQGHGHGRGAVLAGRRHPGGPGQRRLIPPCRRGLGGSQKSGQVLPLARWSIQWSRRT
jgi:hypothetical protein